MWKRRRCILQLELHSIEGQSACKVGEVSYDSTMAEKKHKQTIASLFLVKMTEQWKVHLTTQLIHASACIKLPEYFIS